MSNGSTMSWGTISTNGTQIQLGAGDGGKPAATPSGLIVTRAVETRAGWIGQVIVDKEIVWESAPQEESKDAVEEANGLVVDKIKGLFA